MKKTHQALAVVAVGLLALTLGGSAASAASSCIRAGGWGTGALQGFASFMAQAAMKNSAKAKLGDNVRIGPVREKCELKGLLYECTAFARACR
ncbi:MAG TPA: hypothetical protein VG900_03465 [Hyphomicrobiaceae bacterium]|jgi:hypothetical protein|nr:hypothetical protein [Hyphomicrobiaceae bacterium]